MICTHHTLRALTGSCHVCESNVPVSGTLLSLVSPTAQIKATGDAATIELSKRRLSHFLRAGWHVLEPNTPLEWHWHIECMCDHVQWMLEQWMGRRPQTTHNLVINVPPGSLKSRILSVYAPAWMWLPENCPSWGLLALSSIPSVAQRDARNTRELITSEWYRQSFNIQWDIRPDQDAIGDFGTTAGGSRQSQGLNAGVTGTRKDALFIDDPNDVKDISETKLNQVWGNWYAARNRLNDLRRAVRIGIQQRTHELDWTGRVLEKGDWEHLCIPMDYLPPDYVDSDGNVVKCACGKVHCDTTLGKNDPRIELGEVLHSVRNTPKVLKAEKLALGSLGTAGQLNQRPSTLGGNLFKLKHWRYFEKLPQDKKGNLHIDTCILTCDLQFKKEGTSRSAYIVLASKGARRFVIDVIAEKMGITESIATIKELYAKHKTPHGAPLIQKILIEDKANGPAVMDMLEGVLPGVVASQPNGDKMSRANAVLPQVEAGNVALLEGEPWHDEFKGECAGFPNATYDDIVDALSQGLIDLTDLTGLALARALCQY